MRLKEIFKKQTGLELIPINMPVDQIYMTNVCDSLGCMENCKSCWENHEVKEETNFKLFDDYKARMQNFKIEVITENIEDDCFEDCYGQKI